MSEAKEWVDLVCQTLGSIVGDCRTRVTQLLILILGLPSLQYPTTDTLVDGEEDEGSALGRAAALGELMTRMSQQNYSIKQQARASSWLLTLLRDIVLTLNVSRCFYKQVLVSLTSPDIRIGCGADANVGCILGGCND